MSKLEKISSLSKNTLINHPKNLNNLVKLLKYSENDNPEIAHAALTNLSQLFPLLFSKNSTNDIHEWLDANYKLYIDILFNIFEYNDHRIMKMHAFDLLLNCVKHRTTQSTLKLNTYTFPNLLFTRLVNSSCAVQEEGDDFLVLIWVDLIDKFMDLKYYFLKIIGKLPTLPKKNLSFFLQILLLHSPTPSEPTDYTISPPLKTQDSTQVFTEAWLRILRTPGISIENYKKILIVLHERILPHLSDPTLLIDFLSDSYDAGDGVVSVLALNGLFTLMSEYNLEYPNFYTKLYTLLTPHILTTKYKSRFFRLLQLFLSSTYLSAALVSSFIKRLARLSLSASPSGICMILPLIYNLLKGNASCLRLIHDVDGGVDEITDPFLPNESNPELTNANASYLWEVTSLKMHYLPAVSGLARIFEEGLSGGNYDLEDFLDGSYEKLLMMDYKGADGEGVAVDFNEVRFSEVL